MSFPPASVFQLTNRFYSMLCPIDRAGSKKRSNGLNRTFVRF
ncbi:hypothetical protein HMPREF0372_01427 [Flavonifractor plautii ATCC 29863]|uniref:Uncharacterized protein n=1 Tax=Flavonifractor plautii ATCC 29863 TaxID=411475 RepID=G9YPJ3_FLAPL|nr:hypothetical protein HMPREF0372_01427 [Flavonifractor plautii ATCC 29863]